jgi:type III secretory pathway component EscS
MSTVKNTSSFLPRIIERTHLKLILRSPGIFLPVSTFFVIFVKVPCVVVTAVVGQTLGIVGAYGYLSDTSFECHREKSMQVNCLVQDSRLFNLIQLTPKYFNTIKEAELGSEEVTTSSDSIDTEYQLRFMDNDNRLSDSVFRSTDSNRIESIKNQINSFINSQQSSLVITEKVEQKLLNGADFLIGILFIFGVPLLFYWSLGKLLELYTRIIGHYFVFDKYTRKLEHTVKIFNWSLRSQCYPLSDIKEVCLTSYTLRSYTLRLLLTSYEKSGSQKDILLVKTDIFSHFFIENLSEMQKVVSDFLLVASTNK